MSTYFISYIFDKIGIGDIGVDSIVGEKEAVSVTWLVFFLICLKFIVFVLGLEGNFFFKIFVFWKVLI